MKPVRAEIITTGEEVIHGELVDTNAVWIAQRLKELGFSIQRRTTVGDRLDDLVEVFRDRAKSADIIIVNGGLGPTSDDLAAEAAARALDEPRVLFQEWADRLNQWFEGRGRMMPENNLKQAQLPESATIIDNPIGTACGFRIALGDACLYFTPGVPRELKTMMRDQILPQLSSEFGLSAPVLRRLHSFGISEARVDHMMNAIERPGAISLGFRAHLPLLEIKVTGEGPQAESLVDSFIQQVPPELAEFCVARDQQTQALNIATMLRSTGATLSTAESCTGGLLADAFIQFAGSSDYFVEGVVAYANQAKIRDCEVDPALIESFGAVSSQVARAMAEGVRRRTGSSYGLSTTGVAGPGGGSDEKPVGTVALSLASSSGSLTQLIRLPDFGRTAIRRVSVELAMDMLRRYLCKLPVFADYDLLQRIESEDA